ncbi:MAG: hypothetical protein ACREQY_11070 [Candidatus Binatia bacterium]
MPMARESVNIGGRPRKFREPSRAVTLTLPEWTLRQLAVVDDDRARAIVKVTDAAVSGDSAATKPVQIVEIEPGTAIILVGPSRALQQIPFLRLVEVAPARYLLTIPTGTPIDSLEVAILDVIEGLPPQESHERALLEELRSHFRRFRRGQKMSKGELLFVGTENRRRG